MLIPSNNNSSLVCLSVEENSIVLYGDCVIYVFILVVDKRDLQIEIDFEILEKGRNRCCSHVRRCSDQILKKRTIAQNRDELGWLKQTTRVLSNPMHRRCQNA